MRFTDISIAPSRWLAPLKAESCGSQALYLFVCRFEFLVELHHLRVFWRIVASQLIEHLANGELAYFSHRELLCALNNSTNNHLNSI
jgi:hypothetical protein